jgi:hypothetical protein
MRGLLAFSDWGDVTVPAAAWSGTDAAGRPLVLAHAGPPLAVATNERHTVYAVLAGDIYNARQLRTGLAGRHALASRDDAEVVVHLYEERGVQCVKALRGAFAVALWDERLQRLLLARDQLGSCPSSTRPTAGGWPRPPACRCSWRCPRSPGPGIRPLSRRS